jgi:hypothetical protein
MAAEPKRVLSTWVVACVFLSLWVGRADALTRFAERLASWDGPSSGMANPSIEPFALQHFEIPLSALEHDVAERLASSVKGALVFEKNGESYLRWIIYPDDTRFAPELERWLESKNLDASRHTYFEARRTASRSLIIEDPKTGAEFSAKVSTNSVNGVPTLNKRWPLFDARAARIFSDHIADMRADRAFEHFEVLDETGSFGIPELDQGMTVREIGIMKRDGKYYLPGTAALGAMGRDIATKNGAKDPSKYWKNHFMAAAGRATGELLRRTGLFPESNHAQNILIELDEKMRPTGRVIFRDLSDLHLEGNTFTAMGKVNELRRAGSKYVLGGLPEFPGKKSWGGTVVTEEDPGELYLAQNLLWLSRVSDKRAWDKVYFDALERSFRKGTPMTAADLKPIFSGVRGTWGARGYSVQMKGMRRHFATFRKYRKASSSERPASRAPKGAGHLPSLRR